MNTITSYFLILILQYSWLSALHRSYENEDGGWYMDFCIDHYELPQHTYEILPYLHLIPEEQETRCKKVDCSICDTVWITDGLFEAHEESEDIRVTELEKPYWMCECKEEEAAENFVNSCENDISCRFQWQPSWTRCKNHAVYGGYFSPIHIKYFRLFRNHLSYSNENRDCQCYWPEKSESAAQTNDTAYIRIMNLLKTTPLSKLIKDEELQEEIHGASQAFGFNLNLNEHQIARALVCHCFVYSDYDQILDELNHVSRKHLSHEDYTTVKDEIEKIQYLLCSNFIDKYRICYAQHPHPRIERENNLVNILLSLNKTAKQS